MYVRLATTGSDYAKCKRYFSIPKTYEYPTIMVEKEKGGRLLGYLTTSTDTGYIIAGPLWLQPKLSGGTKFRVLMNIVEAYQGILAHNGIDRFLFWINIDDDVYRDQLKRAMGLEPFEIDDSGRLWYKFQFGEDQLSKGEQSGRIKYNGTGAAN